MSLTAYPGATIYPTLDAAPTGLVGTLEIRVTRDSDNVDVYGPETAGIIESPVASGRYVATIPIALDVTFGEYSVVWDNGGTFAVEDLTIEPLAADVDPAETGVSRVAVTGPAASILYSTPDGQPVDHGLTLHWQLLDANDQAVIADTIVPTEISNGVYMRTFIAPVTAGAYRAVWQATGLEVEEQWAVSADYNLPTIYEVATLLRARTKDTAGNEIGTFTHFTRVTASQAEQLVLQARDHVVSQAGLETDVVAAHRTLVRSLVALAAAMLIELSYFPEQVESGKSAYDRYERMFNQRVEQLAKVTGGTPQRSWASLETVSSTVASAYLPDVFGQNLI